MGTSSARRGPTTALWRAAKGAARRYLSPESGGALDAREVVSRYLAALAETPGQGDYLSVFRFTRKVGQDLGAFWEEGQSQGWEPSLQAFGLTPLANGAAALLAHGLTGALVGRGGGLEEAVVRTSLTLVLQPALQSKGRTSPAHLVQRFLATVVTLRLALDLGESLEAAAGSHKRLQDGLKKIKELIDTVPEADGEPQPPGTPGHWRGLAGWTWVTEIMTALMEKLRR